MFVFKGQNRRQPPRKMCSLRWIGCAATLALAFLTMDAAHPQQEPSSTVNRDLPWLPPDAIRLPDKNDQIKMQEKKLNNQNYEIVNAARKKQIADDATRLLQLATELKAEVDKTDKQALSMNVIRKADTIEKLAHGVKEKMKLTVF